jgi:hypothetical protein
MPVLLMVEDANKRPTNSPPVEANGLSEGARSQPGHHAPSCVTVEAGENGTEGHGHRLADDDLEVPLLIVPVPEIAAVDPDNNRFPRDR